MLILLVNCYGPGEVGQRCIEALKAHIAAAFSAASASTATSSSSSSLSSWRKVHVEVRHADALGDLVCDWDAGMIVSDGTRHNAVRFDKYGAVIIVGAAGEQAVYTPWDLAFYPLTRLVHMCYCVRKPLCGIGLGALVGVYTACTDAAKLRVVNPPFGADRGALSAIPPPSSPIDTHDTYGEFHRVWLDGATGDLYRHCDGWWVPLCNCGLRVEKPVTAAVPGTAASAAQHPLPLGSNNSNTTSTSLPASPRARPVVQGSPRRALTRVVNGQQSPRRDVAGVHPTPSRIRAEHRQHWAVRASRFATSYLTPLRMWRVAGAAAGPKAPLITVVDGPFGPIALSTTPTTAAPSSSSATFPKKHAIVLLLAVDFDRDRGADPVRDLLGFFAAEVKRRDADVFAALPAAQLAAEYTMTGYLFGAQGGRGKGDNWCGWRDVSLGTRKCAPPVCTEAVWSECAAALATATAGASQTTLKAASATFTDPGPPVMAVPDLFVPMNDEHLAASRLPSTTVGKVLPQKASDPLSQASRDKRLRALLDSAGVDPAAMPMTAPVLVEKVEADMSWMSEGDFGLVFRPGETDGEVWTRTVGNQHDDGTQAVAAVMIEVAPPVQPQRPATVGSRSVADRSLVHLLAAPPGTAQRPSSCATFRRAGARTVAARMENSFLPRSHPKGGDTEVLALTDAGLSARRDIAVVATAAVSPRAGPAVGPDGVVNMGLPRALLPAPGLPLPAVARNEADRRARMHALKEGAGAGAGAGTGTAAAPFISAFDGGRGAVLGFDGPEKDGLVEGERMHYMKM